MSRDLMQTDELKAIVRDAYAAIDSSSEEVAYKLYSVEELASVPRSAIRGALGVGNHLRVAEIEAGERILDIGCGAGIDSVLAARRTGPTGRVIALDFLPEMLERTSDAAAEAGLDTSRRSRPRSRRFPSRKQASTTSSRTASSTCRHGSAGCSPSAHAY
jgi:arsenite methyltransferase